MYIFLFQPCIYVYILVLCVWAKWCVSIVLCVMLVHVCAFVESLTLPCGGGHLPDLAGVEYWVFCSIALPPDLVLI